ncbi:MAG: APC family permease [Ignavibacteria bacterium]|nr:APC family permease [Ignavibacteria bacterium]
MSNNNSGEKLTREINLTQATAINMIDMVGIGPFVVLPLVFLNMAGSSAILPWLLGAAVACIDAFTWSELGTKFPFAGGSYNFLRETYKPFRLGGFFSFLFIWQTIIQAPLVIASGSIGFAQYASYLYPLTPIQQKIVSGTLVIALTALLYRKIGSVGKISLILWGGVMCTLAWIIFGAATHFRSSVFMANNILPHELSFAFFGVLGMSTVQTIYCYLGYYNVCHIGGEVQQPKRVIPRSMFLSIAGITFIYLAMASGISGVLPASTIRGSQFIVSTFIEFIYGKQAAYFATILILWIAFASLFAVMLGYSRVPYAAALDGNFFRVFSKIHPTKHFPHISLLTLGAIAFCFSLLFKLKEVITAIVVMRIIVQFIGQTIGLILYRRKKRNESFPYTMPLFPLPAIISMVFWGCIFLSTGFQFMLYGCAAIILGSLVYYIRKRAGFTSGD